MRCDHTTRVHCRHPSTRFSAHDVKKIRSHDRGRGHRPDEARRRRYALHPMTLPETRSRTPENCSLLIFGVQMILGRVLWALRWSFRCAAGALLTCELSPCERPGSLMTLEIGTLGNNILLVWTGPGKGRDDHSQCGGLVHTVAMPAACVTLAYKSRPLLELVHDHIILSSSTLVKPRKGLCVGRWQSQEEDPAAWHRMGAATEGRQSLRCARLPGIALQFGSR